jgi:integrase
MARRRKLDKYVSSFVDRHGRERFRFRRDGVSFYLPPPGTEEYRKAYAEALTGVPSLNRAKPGTVDDLVSRFYQSLAFRRKGDEWQRTVRRIVEGFREKHGKFLVADFKPKHIDSIIAERFDKQTENGRTVGGSAAAKRLRETLKTLFDFAVKQELIASNPVDKAEEVAHKVQGYYAWTEQDIAAFRAHWKLGTKARLAMELMLWTGARRGDARLLPPPVNGRIAFTAGKTGKAANVAVSEQLKAAIDAMPDVGSATLLVTSFGKTFTRNGFGNWFKDRCREAGLPQCTAHGLRKALTRRGAERNVSQQGLKAIGQWSGDREVKTYTDSADKQRLADEAIAKVAEWERSENNV